MDRAGRLVLPKRLRDQLGLQAGTEFDLVVDGGALRLQPLVREVRRTREVDGWPVLVAVPGQTLSDDDVRNLRDADQR